MTTGNQQFLSMAMAYIEAGRILAAAETGLKNDYDYTNVVAYQLLHAVELFYKYMIKNKTGRINRTHDLEALEKEYSSLYPGGAYKINHPFDFSDYEASELNEGENELFEDFLIKYKPKYMDQHLRYPRDENTGGYSFSLDSSIFEDLKKQMLSVS
ncbi:MAG: hypothetical protein ACNYPE_06285 [Candidatus Azotimanducaceae bacterium WSBS_2022_MAG_OTU7]